MNKNLIKTLCFAFAMYFILTNMRCIHNLFHLKYFKSVNELFDFKSIDQITLLSFRGSSNEWLLLMKIFKKTFTEMHKNRE